MRRTKAAFGLAMALTLATGSAWAAGGVTGKGETGGKGGTGPGVTSSPNDANSSEGGFVPQDSATRSQANPDKTTQKVEQVKPWEVGGSFETHRLIRQDDLEGAGANKVFNVFGLFARYDLSEHDHVRIADYFDQRFIADEGETGLRSGDVTFSYTRTQPLPKQFSFAATGVLSAPTSFSSQKAGLITAPTLVLQLDKKIGRYIGVSARTVGSVFISKYREAEGGAPNGKWHVSGTLEAEVAMPFHEALSFGADIATGYTWFYDVQSSDPNVVGPGVTQDSQYPNGPPPQQSYGGEIFARYLMPSLAGIKSDFTLALAQGDPSLGYTSVLHDGVAYYYAFFRQTSEVYGAFSLRY